MAKVLVVGQATDIPDDGDDPDRDAEGGGNSGDWGDSDGLSEVSTKESQEEHSAGASLVAAANETDANLEQIRYNPPTDGCWQNPSAGCHRRRRASCAGTAHERKSPTGLFPDSFCGFNPGSGEACKECCSYKALNGIGYYHYHFNVGGGKWWICT